MIEWWHAVVISVVTALGTGGVAFILQAQRLRAEGQARREDALREHLRQQAEPLYEFLRIMERHQGGRFMENVMRGGGAQKRVEEFFGTKIPPETWEAFIQEESIPDVSWMEVTREYVGRIVIIGDEKLRAMLVKLLVHLSSGQDGWLSEAEVSTLIRDARAWIAESIIELRPPAGEQEEAPRRP